MAVGAPVLQLLLSFPDAEMNGCYFHFGQNVWRRLQANGKATLYTENEQFADKVKQLMALAFVPVQDVIAVFEQLMTNDDFLDLDFLLDYIGRPRRGRRVVPRFPVALWNQVERVRAKLPQSNNYTESWHNAFNGTVNIAHPSVARLARKLQQEQHATMILRAQHATGQPPAKKRKKYIRINEALTTMVDAYDRTDAITYLKNVARVLNINVI